MKINNAPERVQMEEMEVVKDESRRRFFQLAGGIAGAGILLSACKRSGPTDYYVGSGDTGLLNYFYILQQVEAAFYTQAAATPYYGMTASELDLITDLRDTEIGHREFLKTLLGTSAMRASIIDLSPVTFADRSSVLSNAIILEDLEVAALNGAVQLFTNTQYVLTAAKLATVEARHSAYMRDLLSANSFGDTTAVNSNGLDLASAPLTVMASVQKYLHTRYDTSKLPTY